MTTIAHATACPDCGNALTLQRNIPAAVIAEFVVEHRVLSSNRFDSASIVVQWPGSPSLAQLRAEACERRAEQLDGVRADELKARETRRRAQIAERVMACTVCTHTHTEAR